MSRGNFSIPKEKQGLWKRFKFSCKRDGCSASSQIVGFMERFLITHEPGNPQTAITSYSPEGQITQAQVEGWIRQECLARANKVGQISEREIIAFAREKITSGGHLVAMVERVIIWLKGKEVHVWQ